MQIGALAQIKGGTCLKDTRGYRHQAPFDGQAAGFHALSVRNSDAERSIVAWHERCRLWNGGATGSTEKQGENRKVKDVHWTALGSGLYGAKHQLNVLTGSWPRSGIWTLLGNQI